MNLKSLFPENVFLLRGNHDDMSESVGAAEKFGVNQTLTFKYWLLENGYTQEQIKEIMAAEQSLPLMAVRKDNSGNLDFVASHCVPGSPLTLEQIQNKSPDAYETLTWSDNRPSHMDEKRLRENTQKTLTNINPRQNTRPIWVIGHKPTEYNDFARFQLGGKIVQINSAERYPAAFVPQDADKFDPGEHIVDLRRDKTPNNAS